MKLNYFYIQGLFGEFDYKLNFQDLDGAIRIITAPNGYGKSTILKIIDSFFNQKFNQLLEIEFLKFEICFNDKLFFVENNGNTLYISDNKNNLLQYTKEDLFELNKNYHYVIRNELPFLRRLSVNKWIDERDDEILTTKEVKNRYHHIFENNELLKDKSDWLHGVIEKEKIVFVETNRLVNLNSNTDNFNQNTSAVLELSEKILELRNDIVRTQFHISMDQGSNFPERVMDLLSSKRNINVDNVTEKMIQISKFDKWYNKNEIFGNLGLKANIISRLKREEIYANDSFLLVLNSYLEDILERIRFCDDLAKRIVLFKDSINSLFMFKSIDFDPNNGIVVKKKNKNKKNDLVVNEGDFEIDNLSSGEQHLIILLGSLIFNTVPDTLVLIDEPEISLHVAWQKKILSLISQIAEVNNFKVIVATHSFTLINGDWENTIELAELVK